jgi:hypothetical protein
MPFPGLENPAQTGEVYADSANEATADLGETKAGILVCQSSGATHGLCVYGSAEAGGQENRLGTCSDHSRGIFSFGYGETGWRYIDFVCPAGDQGWRADWFLYTGI